jgi:hypothetical protein
MVAPHLIVEDSLPGQKRNYETNEKIEKISFVSFSFVCFVVSPLRPIPQTVVDLCGPKDIDYESRAICSTRPY